MKQVGIQRVWRDTKGVPREITAGLGSLHKFCWSLPIADHMKAAAAGRIARATLFVCDVVHSDQMPGRYGSLRRF